MKQINTVLSFLVYTIILKYIVARWCAEKMIRLFKFFFVRSERELAIWLHYIYKANNNGHIAATPTLCNEGKCSNV